MQKNVLCFRRSVNIIGKYKGKTLLSIKGMDDLKKRLLIVKTFYFKTYHLE